MALHDYRATLHVCGHPLTDSTEPDAEGRYVVDPPTRCHACTAIAIKQGEYDDAKHKSALLWSAHRR